MKNVKAVQPYIHPEYLNFKLPPYEAWVKNGGQTLSPRYPWRSLHGVAYRLELPSLFRNSKVAALMFVEPVSITFDTFPYYATHEIIPFIWDCWPCYYDRMEKWLRKHKVRTAIFTSSVELEEMRKRLPAIDYIHCPEAVDVSLYKSGKELKERTIDLLEFGRSNKLVVGEDGLDGINHVCTKVGDRFIYDNEQLYNAMGDAKVTICLPKSMTHPDVALGVETLTQRYWEAMLSRMVIVGHCPKELEELIGYDPVLSPAVSDSDYKDYSSLIKHVVAHIEDYQSLVDRNRETALRLGDWSLRMADVMAKLSLQYSCRG